ncbi:hypothetical protein K0B03_01110 [Patescibacteria group bacterium]|nr:hypothetical protein [Patescibacteria group bacterium]
MSFVVLVSFLLTFIIVRIYVLLGTFGVIDDPYLYIKGYHIHHLNYGIVIMAIAGFLALVHKDDKNRLKIGILYGIGIALTFDEIGMWFKLEDDYWTRMSYDAVILIAMIFASFVYLPSFWNSIVFHIKKSLKIIEDRKNKEVEK